MRVGLLGYGKAGQAVAQVLRADPRFELCWVARNKAEPGQTVADSEVPVVGVLATPLPVLLDTQPVDALVDFSHHSAVLGYADQVRQRGLTLVSAISSYNDEEMACVRDLGRHAAVMSSPNITLGINFLMMAARLLRAVAPFADVAVLEQHFREKPEVSGTARKLAETLELCEEDITSMRLGGIVGHHEVIFGFPHQTVRLIHSSIRREAFGTGAAFALTELQGKPHGFYTFEDLLLRRVHRELTAMLQPSEAISGGQG